MKQVHEPGDGELLGTRVPRNPKFPASSVHDGERNVELLQVLSEDFPSVLERTL